MIIEGERGPGYILWKTSLSFGKCMQSSPLRSRTRLANWETAFHGEFHSTRFSRGILRRARVTFRLLPVMLSFHLAYLIARLAKS